MKTKLILGILLLIFVVAGCVQKTPVPQDVPDVSGNPVEEGNNNPPVPNATVPENNPAETVPEQGEEVPGPAETQPAAPIGSAIKLDGKKINDTVELTWTSYPSEFRSYKVIRSTTDENPAYPGSDLLTTIAYVNQTDYIDLKPTAGTNYYAVVVLVGVNSKVKSNVVSFEFPDPKVIPGNDIKFNAENINNSAMLTWTKYDGTDLLYYKVERSDTNPSPYYPNDNAIATIPYMNVTSYLDRTVSRGVRYYYAVTVVRKDGTRYTSNPMEFFMG